MWNDGRHRCVHDEGHSVPENSLVDSYCTALSFLGIIYSPVLRSVYCAFHWDLVFEDDWFWHITKKYVVVLKKLDQIPRSTLKNHMHSAAGRDIISSHKDLSALTLQCPVCYSYYTVPHGHPLFHIHKYFKSNPSCDKEYRRGLKDKSWGLIKESEHVLTTQLLSWNTPLHVICTSTALLPPPPPQRNTSPGPRPVNTIKMPKVPEDKSWL